MNIMKEVLSAKDIEAADLSEDKFKHNYNYVMVAEKWLII